jgi:hypothetical protein
VRRALFLSIFTPFFLLYLFKRYFSSFHMKITLWRMAHNWEWKQQSGWSVVVSPDSFFSGV